MEKKTSKKKNTKKSTSKNTEQAKELVGSAIKVYEEKTSKQSLPQSRYYAWTAYLIFFLPFIINPKDEFVDYHTNNAIKLLMLDIISFIMIALGLAIKSVSSLFLTIASVTFIVGAIILLCATTVTKIYMIYQSVQGKYTELPIFKNMKF